MVHRWITAAAAALVLHAGVAVRFCGNGPRDVQERVRGAPMPAALRVDLVETIDTGARIAAALPYAPTAREHEDDATMDAPQRPRMGLWVMDVPLAGHQPQRVDAGPE